MEGDIAPARASGKRQRFARRQPADRASASEQNQRSPREGLIRVTP